MPFVTDSDSRAYIGNDKVFPVALNVLNIPKGVMVLRVLILRSPGIPEHLVQFIGHALPVAEEHPNFWIKASTHRLTPTLPR